MLLLIPFQTAVNGIIWMEALKHTEAMIADGADIIDIGGESTRPGHTPVSADEEAQRVLPVIEAVKKHFDIPVSVDTFKSSVAEVLFRQELTWLTISGD